MTLHCITEQSAIYEALINLQNITNKKGTLSILVNVLIETTERGLFFTGTDLEIGLKIFVPAEVKEEGEITLPSKKLFEIVRESGSSLIEIEEKDNSWVYIRSGESVYNLAGMPSTEFPPFPEYKEDNFTTIESFIFQELIEKTLYSVANEQENVYTLTSLLFQKETIDGGNYLKMVASDGHRLSLMSKSVTNNLDKLDIKETTLVPKKGVQEWKRFCDTKDTIDISFEENKLILKADDSIMIIRVKDGEFPNYNAIIGTVNKTDPIRIKRKILLESLKRINLFTEDIFHTISLKIDNEKMVLSSENIDLGNAKDQINIDYSGEPLSLAFNCKYFIETLQVMEGEFVDAYINSKTSPSLIESEEDPGFISIIMPMQL